MSYADIQQALTTLSVTSAMRVDSLSDVRELALRLWVHLLMDEQKGLGNA